MLEGSVRREGDHVRLTLQLIDARTDDHIWSENFDRTLASAMTLQSEVAAEVASQLSVRLASGARAVAPTTDPEAYDLYLKARLVRKQLNPVALLADFQRIESLLSRAVARDPDFGIAYVERANHGLSAYLGAEARENRLRQARADLDAAGRLIPGDATLKATEVLYRHIMGTDRTVAPIIEATAQGGIDPLSLYFLAVALAQARRFDESLALIERWVPLDPANLWLLRLYAVELDRVRKPQEALRIYDLVNARADSDFYAAARAYTLFACTGKIKEFRAAIDRQKAIVSADVNIGREYDALRFERRYADLKRLLGESLLETISRNWDYRRFLGAGGQPVAEMRGWTALLLGDAASAAAEGRALTSFIAAAPKLPTNGWYLCSLGAEALLFAGDKTAASKTARACLALAPRSQDTLAWRAVAAMAAGVFAWAGAPDDAMDLLEQLATVKAGLGPAEITRDPIFAVPLADNARYQALKAKLEAEMAATAKELGVAE